LDEKKSSLKNRKKGSKYGYPVRRLRFPVALRAVIQATVTFSIYSIIIWVLLSRQSASEQIMNSVNFAVDRVKLASLSFEASEIEELPFSPSARAQSTILEDFRNIYLDSDLTPRFDEVKLSLIVQRDDEWVHYLSTDDSWVNQPWQFGEFREELEPGRIYGNGMNDEDYENQLISIESIERANGDDSLEYLYLQYQIGDQFSEFFLRNSATRNFDFTDARLVFLVSPEQGNPVLLEQAWFIGRYLLLSFLMILPFILIISYQFTGRARSLRETIRRIAMGDYSARSDLPGKDEIGQLSDHINGLAIALEEREKLQSAVDLASQLQSDLLPPKPPCPEELGYEIAQANRMSNQVGGDFFDYKCDSKTLYVVVGDISGHGLESGLMMSASRTAIRVYLDMNLEPKELAERLNHQLYEDLIQGHFLTVAIMHLELETGEWWHLSCGHEPTMVMEGNSVRQLGTTCPPLGMFPKINVKKEVERGVLKSGEIMLMTTDGLRECADAQDIQLGQAFMREELASNKDPYKLVDNLIAHAKRHRSPLPLEDDITIVTIKRP